MSVHSVSNTPKGKLPVNDVSTNATSPGKGEFARLAELRKGLPRFNVNMPTDNEYVPLWLGVMAQAIEDALTAPPALAAGSSKDTIYRNRRATEDYQSAREWLTSMSREPRTFRWICEVALNTTAWSMLAKLKAAYPGLADLPSAHARLTTELALGTVAT
jgi:hypothetical protein